MSNNHSSIHDRTLNNENLAGPEPHLNGHGNNHHNLRDRTLNNENLTAPTPRMESDHPLEKDFSPDGNGKHTLIL
jgi:uncharacterized protein